MARIAPFIGLRYADHYNQQMDRLVTPPYDIISPEEQNRFYRVHKHNIIRLELGKVSDADSAQDNRYTRAHATLHAWRQEGVLKTEPKPAFYLVKTDYLDPQGESKHFTGFFARVQLEPLGEGKILPHEKTYEGPKTDRFNLLKETGVSFSPVLALYHDQNQTVGQMMRKIVGRKPAVDFKDWSGSRQRMWVVTNPAEQTAIAAAFRAKKLLIADGHHRYSTALRYQREFGRQAGPGADYVMMCLAETHDEGLCVLPVFRLIQGVPEKNWQSFQKNVEKNFEVIPVGDSRRLCELQRQAAAEARQPVIAYLGGQGKTACLIKLRRDGAKAKAVFGQHSEIYARLDVAILNQLILNDLLGIRPGEEQGRVTYTKNFKDAFTAVRQNAIQAAFLPGLPDVDAIWDLAKQGETMPQKSTYFLPKIITGLVMNPVALPAPVSAL